MVKAFVGWISSRYWLEIPDIWSLRTNLWQRWQRLHWRTVICIHLFKNYFFKWQIQIIGNESSPVAQLLKNPLANTGDTKDESLIPRWGRSPEEAKGNPFQYFAWEIPWTGEPGGWQSMGLQRVRHAIWFNKLRYSYTMPLILEALRAFISSWQN